MRGGAEPTVTDAHLACGTLQAGSFLGGRMEVDVAGRGFLAALSQPSKNTASILKQVNICLGLLCQSYPAYMKDFSEDILRHY